MAGRGLVIGGAIGLAIAFFTVWTFVPLGYTLFRSFFDWHPAMPDPVFVGLANYRNALVGETFLLLAAKNTLVFTLVNVGIGTVLCLGVAVLINAVTNRTWATLFRASYFVPYVASLAAVALTWQFIYQPRFGILNSAVRQLAIALGLPSPEIGWLTRPQWAMTAVIIVTLWKYLGFRMVIFLAGLQDIPEALYDAAKIDGAGHWAQVRCVTVPLLAPTLMLTTVWSTIHSLQFFGPIFMMTRGGPMNATLTVVYLIYRQAFEQLRFGAAAAISFLLFGVILGITALQTKVLRPRFEY